jgi:CheY-like chemotaxis protein
MRHPEFELVTCNQGRDAITIVTDAVAGQLPFDAVILDIRMPPGINGVDAGERIRQIDLDVPIVFVSGYSDISHEETLVAYHRNQMCASTGSRFRSADWRRTLSKSSIGLAQANRADHWLHRPVPEAFGGAPIAR